MIRKLIARLRARLIATLAVAISSLLFLISLIPLTQPNLKVCKIVSNSGDVLKDCNCIGFEVDVTQELNGLGDLNDNVEAIYECS